MSRADNLKFIQSKPASFGNDTRSDSSNSMTTINKMKKYTDIKVQKVLKELLTFDTAESYHRNIQ